MRREEEKTKVIGEIEKMKANFKNKFCKTQIKTNIQNQTGITLLVLVITIIILLILAGITINAITGDNGIIGNAGSAKEEAEIANEKDVLEEAIVQAMGKNKYGNIEEDKLQEQLDKETGEGKTDVNDVGDDFEVIFIDSDRYYIVDKDGNIEGEYPIIKDKYPGDITVGIDGEELNGKAETEEGGKPYEIWCIEDLVEWSQNYEAYQDAYIKLGRTLNFESRLSYANGKILNCNSIEELRDLLTNTTGSGFTPIMNFSGTFDGQSNEIQNIYINKTGRAGLFQTIDNGIIQNLGISGNVMGTEECGGIFANGYNEITISNCYNKANIISEGDKSWAGGICGIMGTGRLTIVNCYNSEETKIMGDIWAGGILGGTRTAAATPFIYNCYNLGNINGATVGGIIGYVYDHAGCINVYSAGNITGSTIGGIVGAAMWNNVSANKFENCYFLKSNIVQQSAGKNITVNATMLEELTDETINELNTYITNNSTLTSGWKKWTIENHKPQFIE